MPLCQMRETTYRMSGKKITRIAAAMLLAASSQAFWAETEGERLFRTNRPEQAAPVLEQEIADGTASPESYNYLGLCYYQMGDYVTSAEKFSDGLSVPGTDKKILAFNRGNSLFAAGEYRSAAESFSLALSADPDFLDALLNRANSLVMDGDYEEAADSYRTYIGKFPASPQRRRIEKMLSVLESERRRAEEDRRLAEAEAARRAEEEKRFQEEIERKAEEARLREQERIAAEKEAEEKRIAEERRAEEERIARETAEREAEEARKAAEAEKRRKLLENVAKSLQDSDSTNIQSGAEDIMDYEHSSELD